MANHRVASYNATTKRLGIPQGADGYLVDKTVQLDAPIVTTQLIDGRRIATMGTKLDFLTVAAPINLDTVAATLVTHTNELSLISITQAVDLDAMETKLAWLTVTQAVNLDTIEARVNALDAAVVLKGTWNAGTGLFPVSTMAGESWIVSGAGTVDAIPFAVNDRIIALVNNALVGTYTGNWHKADYTDQVLSVAGKTGAVTLLEADITDLQLYVLPVDLDSIAKLNLLTGESIIIDGDARLTDSRVPLAHTHADLPVTVVAAATHNLVTANVILHVTYTATGNVTITLKSDQVINGRKLKIKAAGGVGAIYTITIVTEGAETIDGEVSQEIGGEYDAIGLYSDGFNWFIE